MLNIIFDPSCLNLVGVLGNQRGRHHGLWQDCRHLKFLTNAGFCREWILQPEFLDSPSPGGIAISVRLNPPSLPRANMTDLFSLGSREPSPLGLASRRGVAEIEAARQANKSR